MPRNPNNAVLLFALLLAAFCVGFWAWQPTAEREPAPDLPAAAITTLPPGTVTDPLVEPAVDAPATPDGSPSEPSAPPDAGPFVRAPIVQAPTTGTFRPTPVTTGSGITPANQRSTRPQTVVFTPQFTSYTIQRGEASFEAVSRRVYGTSRHASAIARANPLTSPDKLRAGQKLLIPKDPSNIQGRVGTIDVPTSEPAPNSAAPNPAPSQNAPIPQRTHTVAQGETLSDIAQQYYGSSAKWKDLFEANRAKLTRPERVKAGMVLIVP